VVVNIFIEFLTVVYIGKFNLINRGQEDNRPVNMYYNIIIFQKETY
jgi:hypothetical protein